MEDWMKILLKKLRKAERDADKSAGVGEQDE